MDGCRSAADNYRSIISGLVVATLQAAETASNWPLRGFVGWRGGTYGQQTEGESHCRKLAQLYYHSAFSCLLRRQTRDTKKKASGLM